MTYLQLTAVRRFSALIIRHPLLENAFLRIPKDAHTEGNTPDFRNIAHPFKVGERKLLTERCTKAHHTTDGVQALVHLMSQISFVPHTVSAELVCIRHPLSESSKRSVATTLMKNHPRAHQKVIATCAYEKPPSGEAFIRHPLALAETSVRSSQSEYFQKFKALFHTLNCVQHMWSLVPCFVHTLDRLEAPLCSNPINARTPLLQLKK